jgi:hypothetical protein
MHAYNPSYLRGRGRRIVVCGWPRQKCQTLFEKQTKSPKTGSVAQVVGVLA